MTNTKLVERALGYFLKYCQLCGAEDLQGPIYYRAYHFFISEMIPCQERKAGVKFMSEFVDAVATYRENM